MTEIRKKQRRTALLWRMLQHAASGFLAALLLCTVGTAEASAPFPGVSAEAAAVYDTTSERFLYEKKPDQKMRIASTTKIMTALVALENMDPQEIVEIERDHYAEGSSMYLRSGEEMRAIDLLYGLMLMSGNDAALAIAEGCAGSTGAFVSLMNAKAAQIGMTGSSFRNPNGLDEEGHYSTARDMALLAAEAMKNKTFREIVGTKRGSFAGRSMTNHNKLLFRIEGSTGIKTGFTKSAGRCLVSSVLRGGREIIVVTLNAPSDWKDHAALYNTAFSSYKEKNIVEAGDFVAEIPVVGGTARYGKVSAADSASIWISEEEEVTTEVFLPRFVYAPVRCGDPAGEMRIMIGEKVVKRIALCYDSEISIIPRRPGIFESIGKFLKNIVRGRSF